MEKNQRWIAAILIFVFAFILGSVLMKSLQSSLSGSTMRLGIDLYPNWIGSQAVLNGQSPYSLKTQQHIWQAIYGSPDTPNGNSFRFYNPPAIVTLLIPFILAGLPMNLAAAEWCAFLWALWFTVLVAAIAQLVQKEPKQKLVTVLLLVCGLLFRPAFSNYILGQYSLFSVLMLIAAWVSYQNKKVALVGIFASLSLIKPTLTVIPTVLFGIFYFRSLKGFLAFGVTSILLYLPPTVMLGWWVPDYLKNISQYTIENRVSWFAGDIMSVSGIVWLISAVLLVILGWSNKDKLLVLSSSIALNAIFVPHTADYDLVALICLIFWLGNHWLQAKQRRGWLALAILSLVLFPWISLLVFIQYQLPVERWYRFIWLVYPVLILLSTLSTCYLRGWRLFPIFQRRQAIDG